MFSRLHWTNTFLPLIVPCFFGNAFYIFLLRQFFLGIPRDLSEAARLEGASELQILWHVILPLARSALLAVALFQFLFSWNDFLGPLIYLNDQSKFTLALGLANMQSAIGLSDFGAIMAAATVTVAPVTIVFIFTQRYFIGGILTSRAKS
jgi:multiple sugar transport system permease protein